MKKFKIFMILTIAFTLMVGVLNAEDDGRQAICRANFQAMVGSIQCGQGGYTEDMLYGSIMYDVNNGYGPSISQIVIDEVLNKGVLLDRVEEFKSIGLIPQSYVAPGTSTKTETPAVETAKPTPEAFTVTDVTPYDGWATQIVNIRDGASTQYNKVGNLKKYEKVSVTGTASTGWLRIKTEDGKEVYVSGSYITKEDFAASETQESATEITSTEPMSSEPVSTETVAQTVSTETAVQTESSNVSDSTTELQSESSKTEASALEKTNIPVIILIVAVVLLAGGAGIYYYSKKTKK